MNISSTKLMDARLLMEGDLIVVQINALDLSSSRDGRAFDLHLVVEANPRYGEGSSQPYGLLRTKPWVLRDDSNVPATTVFAPYGTYYWLAIPQWGYEPDMAARIALVPDYDPEG